MEELSHKTIFLYSSVRDCCCQAFFCAPQKLEKPSFVPQGGGQLVVDGGQQYFYYTYKQPPPVVGVMLGGYIARLRRLPIPPTPASFLHQQRYWSNIIHIRTRGRDWGQRRAILHQELLMAAVDARNESEQIAVCAWKLWRDILHAGCFHKTMDFSFGSFIS